MALTPPARVPNSGNPGTFNEDADYIFGWFATFVSQFNAELPFISSKGWATYGGSANAITLTAGFVSLVRGMQVRFRATASNTSAATINLDGTGARPCRTITGAALPAGYIRTDTDTTATYDGTNWVLDRQIERGSNANGEYMRSADGTQFCWLTGVEFGYSSASNLQYEWTYPASFSGAPVGLAAFSPAGADYPNLSIGDLGVVRHTGSTTVATYIVSKVTGAPNFPTGASTKNAKIAASGRWY